MGHWSLFSAPNARCWRKAAVRRRPASARCDLAASNPPLFLRHFRRKQDSRACGSDPCDSFSGDVVGRSVCRRTDREIKAAEQGHAAIEAHQLHRDLTLVMVHREHRVKRAVFRAKENRICGKRPFGRDTVGAGLFHGGFNRVYFLAPEISPTAPARIKAPDPHPPPPQPPPPPPTLPHPDR